MKPLFWITGNYYDSQKEWKEICKRLDSPSIEAVDGSSVSAADVILLLKNRDIFDDRPRIIKLQGIPEDYALITDYLRFVNDANVLVVDGPVGYRKMKRIIPASSSKFYKTFVKQGKVFKFDMQAKTNAAAAVWVQKVAQDLGKSIDKESADLIVESKGKVLDLLYAEINKLVSFQTKKKITLSDVKECCVPECLDTTWDLIDALNSQNYDKALEKLQQFYGQAGMAVGANFYGDCQRLMGAINKNFTFLLMLKDSCGDNLSYNGAKKAISGYKKREKKGEVYYWDKDVFDEWWMNMQIKRQDVNHAFKLPYRHLYAIKRDVGQCMFVCRINSTILSRIRICLDSLVMLICGKLSPEYSSACKGWK